MPLKITSATVLQFTDFPAYLTDWQTLEESLIKKPFKSCAPQQESSEGFVPIADMTYEDGNPIHLLTLEDKWHLFCYVCETKTIPSSVIREEYSKRAQAIHARTGHWPTKMDKQSIYDDIKAELLPRVFPRRTATYGYFDTESKWLVIGSASGGVVGSVCTCLRDVLGTLPVSYMQYEEPVPELLTEWAVAGSVPAPNFTVLDAFEMKSLEDKSVVRCQAIQAASEEVTCHVDCGKYISKIRLSYADTHTFTLTDALELRSIKCLIDAESDNPQDGFLSDMHLFCTTLGRIMVGLHTLARPKEITA